MSNTILNIGKLVVEIHPTVPNGFAVDIWESDDFLRPKNRKLLIALTGAESQEIVNAINNLSGNEKPQQPQSAPVRLVELCESLLNDKWFTGCYCVTSEKIKEALAAEKRMQELVDMIIAVCRQHASVCGGEHCQLCKYINALDAFDKERGA